MAGLNQDLKVDGEQYFDAQTVPQNDTENSSSVKNQIGAQNSSIEVKVVVTTEIGLADTKVFTVKLQESSDDSTFTDKETLYTKTASGAETIAVDTVLAQYTLPTDIKKYTRVVVTTDDAAATGAIDAYPRYIPR